MIRIFLLIFAFSIQVHSECRPITPDTRDCRFYTECLEENYQCGQSGYPLGYGKKYCERFNTIGTPEPYLGLRLSEQGLIWKDHTLRCLQSELLSEFESLNSCQEVEALAYKTHSDCYTREPYSVCSLPASDLATIPLVVDGIDYISYNASKQFFEVISLCLWDWTSDLNKLLDLREKANLGPASSTEASAERIESQIKELQLKIDFVKSYEK